MLAARAYLKASIESDGPETSKAYRENARFILMTQSGPRIEELQVELLKEITEADAYFAQIELDEQQWIDAGKDLDAEFARAYYEAPRFESPGTGVLGMTRARSWTTLILLGAGFLVASVVLLLVLLKANGQSRATA